MSLNASFYISDKLKIFASTVKQSDNEYHSECNGPQIMKRKIIKNN